MNYNRTDNIFNGRFPWSFLGFVTGLLFGIFGIWIIFFHEKTPNFKLRVISKAPVVSLREDIPNLAVVFDGEDIRKAQKGLTLLTVEFSNTGNLPIRTSDFDDRFPFKVMVSPGKVIRADVLDSTNEYLCKVFEDAVVDSNSLEFPKFIIEPDQFLLIKLLVLHDENTVPSLSTSGKIANISQVSVLDTDHTAGDLGRKPRVFDGNSRTQLLRILTYGLGTPLVIAGLIGLTYICWRFSVTIIDSRKRLKRKEKVGRYLLAVDDELALVLRAVAKPYITYGPRYLRDIVYRLVKYREMKKEHPDESDESHAIRYLLDVFPFDSEVLERTIRIDPNRLIDQLEKMVRVLGQ